MDVAELLDAAKRKKGTLAVIAKELGMHQNRLSEWRRGVRKPDASELAYLAECAGLPVLETVAEIEAQLEPRFESTWRKALRKLRDDGVVASVAAVVLIASLWSAPQHADAVAVEGSKATLSANTTMHESAFCASVASILPSILARGIDSTSGSTSFPSERFADPGRRSGDRALVTCITPPMRLISAESIDRRSPSYPHAASLELFTSVAYPIR